MEYRRPLKGNLKCPIISSWLIFLLHFIYVTLFHLRGGVYISYLDIIFNLFLLFSIQFIAIFISLSNIHNSVKCFKIAFAFSIINIIIILLSITIIVFGFFFIDKFRTVLKPHYFLDDINIKINRVAISSIFIGIKVIEFLPFIILICYLKKINRSVGIINNPQMPINGGLLRNDEDDEI